MVPAADLDLRLAQDAADLRAAQRLRYEVFAAECGASGPTVDHDRRLEVAPDDARADHLLLIDRARPAAPVVGTCRLMRGTQLGPEGRFLAAREYDLAALFATGRPLLELSRTCLDPAHRGGPALMRLWQGLLAYVERHEIALVFGVGSFPGTDPAAIAPALALLHRRHLAPPGLRIRARGAGALAVDQDAGPAPDRRAAMAQVPPLIKSYLRLGGAVGAGAYVDRAFNTIDIGIVLDMRQVPARMRAVYAGGVLR